jgi:hypothetical protein
MRRRGTRRSERQRELEWTDTLRWAELPADLRDQLAAELRVLLERAATRQAGRVAWSGRDE